MSSPKKGAVRLFNPQGAIGATFFCPCLRGVQSIAYRNVEISGSCAFKSITLAWNQLAAADDGERTWIAIPSLSDSSLSIRTTTPTKVVFNGLSGWKSVVT